MAAEHCLAARIRANVVYRAFADRNEFDPSSSSGIRRACRWWPDSPRGCADAGRPRPCAMHQGKHRRLVRSSHHGPRPQLLLSSFRSEASLRRVRCSARHQQRRWSAQCPRRRQYRADVWKPCAQAAIDRIIARVHRTHHNCGTHSSKPPMAGTGSAGHHAVSETPAQRRAEGAASIPCSTKCRPSPTAPRGWLC